MITLSDRLQLMANQIRTGQTVADIGTDHGFLPIYLLQSGIAKKVIMADISPGSLEKARMNFGKFFPAENESSHLSLEGSNKEMRRYDFRLGNGLSVLETGEADAVVIAGMGGILISEIMGVDLEKSRLIERFILQPRNGQGKLRYWLYNNGFLVNKELLVREGKFICEVLVVRSGDCGMGRECGNCGEPGSFRESKGYAGFEADDIRFEIPARLIEDNGALGQEFAQRRLAIEKHILTDMEKGSNISAEKKERQLARVAYLSGLLGK